ncbi:MAG: hypothetical protein A2Z71_02485 [Chloroflexi bacterium RBG_13_50_21]|nr:MAG: hypothetical protein A2Z71_02485 [Chloroflexi bacterium RBG_13_50_21]
MIDIVVRYLGGIRMERGMEEDHLILPDGSNLHDLIEKLEALGFDIENNDNVYILDGYGFAQYPPDQLLTTGQVVAIFPYISGG